MECDFISLQNCQIKIEKMVWMLSVLNIILRRDGSYLKVSKNAFLSRIRTLYLRALTFQIEINISVLS